MESADFVKVVAPDGSVGTVDTHAYKLDGSQDMILVQFADGRRMTVPFSRLIRQASGDYTLAAEPPTASPPLVVPVVHEQVVVGKRTVETGCLRVNKTVREEEQVIDPPLLRTDAVVEHVPINRPIQSIPPIRRDGPTTIVPVVEEVLVVEKRLVLREELHITQRTSEYHNPQRVVLRHEEVNLQREKSPESMPPPGMAIAPPPQPDDQRQQASHQI
jgi:uncharacterized protein (TIGR02271 family)